MAKQESWFVKNIFGLIALSITIGGFIFGYAKLQMTVQDIQKRSVDKEIIRNITKELIKENTVVIEKDIYYIQKDIKRINDNISRLYKISNKLEIKSK